MNLPISRIVAFVIGLVVLIWLWSSLFVVDQRRFAIVISFGEVKTVISEPGLHFKLPTPFQNVVFLDKPIQTIDTDEADRYITSEKKNLMVDLFVKWQIADPKRFYTSVQGNMGLAAGRLTQIIRSALNEEFTKRTVREVVSDQRDQVMRAVVAKVAHDTADLGVKVIDVRLKRVDLLPEISDSVYGRMQAERKKVANEKRSTGAAEAEQIKADADRQRKVILADAYEKAQNIMGDGDAKASEIYAEAFGRDPAFYSFYQSLQAYRASFKDRHDLLVLDPSSEFFRYLRNPDATPLPAPKR
jgi:modulator of FtsH protease HflC